MALVVMVITDEPDGKINLRMDVEPPLSKDAKLTLAQQYGLIALDAVADGQDYTRK